MPGGRGQKTFFVLCVRGNPAYAKNDFHDNKNGTVTDRATGLMWSRADSGKGMNWQDALAWVQEKNGERFLGHKDWRLPSIKELQGIVDYTRSPETSGSAAIDPVFSCAAITNAVRERDFPYYWSATTHANLHGGEAAMYVAFGRAAGWMPALGPGAGVPRPVGGGPAGSGKYNYVDVHGAGAQRSDPKAGDPKQFSRGRGPQGDVICINNFVRLVRSIGASE
jgi:hypothetical protein